MIFRILTIFPDFFQGPLQYGVVAKAAEAGLITMLEVVLGPLWVLVAFGEWPSPLSMVGGALVMAALIWRLAPEIGMRRPAWLMR